MFVNAFLSVIGGLSFGGLIGGIWMRWSLERKYKELYNAVTSFRVWTTGERSGRPSKANTYLECIDEGIDRIEKEHQGFKDSLVIKASNE